MTNVIALTQFVFIALGTLAVNILVKAEGYPIGGVESYPALSVYIVENGLWLFLIPAAWLLLAMAADKVSNSALLAKVMTTLGVLLTIGIFAAFAGTIFLHY